MIEKNVMQLYEYKDMIVYRVSCECGSKECDMTLELEKDHDMIFLNIYKNLHLDTSWEERNFFKGLWLRIKYALKILFVGRVTVEESFIMKENQINGFIKALEEGKAKLEKS